VLISVFEEHTAYISSTFFMVGMDTI